MSLTAYKWRGQEYLLVKDLAERYGPSIRASWGKVPEQHRLILTGEIKDFFCEKHGIEHRNPKILLLRNTEQAWFSLIGVPRTPEALEFCRKLKDSAFDFFWFNKRHKELGEKIRELKKEKKRKTRRLVTLLQKVKERKNL